MKNITVNRRKKKKKKKKYFLATLGGIDNAIELDTHYFFFFTFIHDCSYEQSKMLLEELEELENNFFFFIFYTRIENFYSMIFKSIFVILYICYNYIIRKYFLKSEIKIFFQISYLSYFIRF